jgi:ABC-2 type transport system ATP-binding protein
MSELTTYRDRMTSALPLGWKQRLALGCAVLHEPSVLFLDEPTSGVDPLARRQFWDVIRLLADRGTTVFVSTHYMEEAEYCDRLAFMNRGKLVALGTPAELRAQMTEPILLVTTDDAPRAVPLLAREPGMIDVSLFGRGVRLVVDDAERAESVVRERLRTAGLGCRAVERIVPSLEDVFVASVTRAGGALVG